MPWVFKDPKDGKEFDPRNKFGVLDPEDRLIHEPNISTSYGVILPTDYYKKHAQSL